jgi:hypothetical protein
MDHAINHPAGPYTTDNGHLAGHSLDEWNAAYAKVEHYFYALRVQNKTLLGQSVLRVLERAQARAATEPNISATQLAVEEMDRLIREWFASVLQIPPDQHDPTLSTRGRLALLLADMPGKWQDQFLRPGPWPEEFVSAMRESYLRAGPDFQLSKMVPRPFDLGPLTTLQQFSRLPYLRMILIWLFFILIFVVIFKLTHQE